MNFLPYSLFLCLALPGALFAQAPPAPPAPAAPPEASDNISDIETKDGRWDCSLPGGNFAIGVGKIVATSIHQYVIMTPGNTASPVPLPTRVHEVNLAYEGSQAVRFYFVEAAVDGGALGVAKVGLDRLDQVAEKAADTVGSLKPWQMVQKDYPHSTHAHTVEFRVAKLADLHRLYGSLKRSWINGKGANFSIR